MAQAGAAAQVSSSVNNKRLGKLEACHDNAFHAPARL
jgi:hypothetical protein